MKYVYDSFTELVTAMNTTISVNISACRKWFVQYSIKIRCPKMYKKLTANIFIIIIINCQGLDLVDDLFCILD